MTQHEDPVDRMITPAALLSVGVATLVVLVASVGTPLDVWAGPDTVVAGQTPNDLVDALHGAFGDHHARAVHAKGIILAGTFTPNAAAKELSSASIFAGGVLPVTARFSDFTGIPTIPDTSTNANPRGFAFKIKASDGEQFDVVTHSFNGFPVATSDEFASFLRSVGASGPDAAHPTPIEKFLDAHPIAKTFVTSQKPPPVSYATTAFFGVNSFKYESAQSTVNFVRYRMVPSAGEQYLAEDELKEKVPDYLAAELVERLRSGPVSIGWFAQISATGDRIGDPSVAWPDDRKLVKLGTIELKSVARDPQVDRQTLFLPGTAHRGIEAADTMLGLRNEAYPLSFSGRQ